MKASVVPLAVLFSTAFSAPTPSPNGVSFPITDLLGSDLTVAEYTRKLENQNEAAPALAKRQYSGTTYNQLTDGTACRPVSIIYARGTTQEGNIGDVGSEGPTFMNALATSLGGASRLAVQGVDYPADVAGFLAGGSAAGATTMLNLINQTASRCPSTKIVVSGYSQGAQLVHTATQGLTAANAARVSAGKPSFPKWPLSTMDTDYQPVVTFGDADRDETFGPVAASKILIICHEGDNICDNGIIITPEHRNYEMDAPTAAAFVAARV